MAEKIIHLDGTLYKVQYSLIKTAGEAQFVEKGVKFYNPRNIQIDGKPISKGFTPEEMTQLRESIKNEGLHHPLLLSCKKEGDTPILLSGERRLRCVKKLIADNEKVFSHDKGWVDASELYEYIECRIFYGLNIKQMFQHSFTINDTGNPVGEGATLSAVKYWYDNGFTDTDVAQMTQSSVNWVKDTKKIISLDQKCFNAFLSNEINRTVALHLAGIEDVNERLIRLAKSKELAAKRVSALKEKIQVKLQEAEAKQEIAQAMMTDATKIDDKELAKIAKTEMQKASDKIKKHQEELGNVKVKVKSKDFDEENGIAKSLSLAKIEKHWIPQAKAIMKEHGKNIEYASLIHFLWFEGIIGGEKDLDTLFKAFKVKCKV